MLRDLDAQVLAISTDNLAQATALVERVGLEFPILYDPQAEVVRRYGVYDILGDGVAAPSTFIIDRDGIIRWRYIGSDMSARPGRP